MNEYFRRTWIDVNLDALKHNYEIIKNTVTPGCRIIAVVKADAYGHGVENVVKEFSDCGCDFFAVSNLEEALQVRSANADSSVLILGYTPPEYAETLAVNNITQSVFNLDYAQKLSESAVKQGVQINIHIKVDTGMNRLGFVFHNSDTDSGSVSEAAEACRLEGLYPEGIFTHFSSADEDGEGAVFTRIQYDLFRTFIDSLEFEGIRFEIRHCCNSAATVLYPEMHLDAVRPGIILYGLNPSDYLSGKLGIIPAMKLKTVISMVKEINDDSPVSYGRKYSTGDKKIKIATIPIGYADGFPRALSGSAVVKIGGKTAPVIGAICMDQCMIDVTDIDNVSEGLSVTVFDNVQGSPLSVDSVAGKVGTINYEIICGINKRVPRIYKREGEIEAVADYMK